VYDHKLIQPGSCIQLAEADSVREHQLKQTQPLSSS